MSTRACPRHDPWSRTHREGHHRPCVPRPEPLGVRGENQRRKAFGASCPGSVRPRGGPVPKIPSEAHPQPIYPGTPGDREQAIRKSASPAEFSPLIGNKDLEELDPSSVRLDDDPPNAFLPSDVSGRAACGGQMPDASTAAPMAPLTWASSCVLIGEPNLRSRALTTPWFLATPPVIMIGGSALMRWAMA